MVSLIAENIQKRKNSIALQEIIQPAVLDGTALSLEDESVDLAFSIFGIFLFPNRAKGFEELHRVLKKGSLAVITSWTDPPKFGIGGLLADVTKLHLEQQQMTSVTPPPQQQPQPPIKMPLGDSKEVVAELQAAGFRDISVHVVSHDWTFDYDTFIAFGRTNPMLVGLREKVGSAERLAELIKHVLLERFPSGECSLSTAALVTLAYK